MAQHSTSPTVPRILLVDDEPVVLDILSRLLNALGYEVCAAGSGVEGLALLNSRAFDLVFTDYLMPGLDGFDLARAVKQKAPDIPVIMITGQSRETVMEKMEDGTVDFLLYKPFDLFAIQQVTRSFLNEWRAPSRRQAVYADP